MPKNTPTGHFSSNMSMSNLNTSVMNGINGSMNGMNTINVMSSPNLIGSNHSMNFDLNHQNIHGQSGGIGHKSRSNSQSKNLNKLDPQNLKKKRNRTSSREKNLKKKSGSNDKLDWAMEDHEVKIYDWDPPIVDQVKNEINIRWKDKGNKSKAVKLVGGWINWKCRDATKLEFDESDKFWKATLTKERFTCNMEEGENKVEFKFIINDKKWLMSEFYKSCKDKSGNLNNYLDF